MLLFASVALYLTALWNKGFIYSPDWVQFLQIAVLLALVSYMVVPLSKIILFPIHLLTFGLLSIVCYMALFYLVDKYSAMIVIKSWVLPGFNLAGVAIRQVTFSEAGNLLATSVSASVIINTLEKIT